MTFEITTPTCGEPGNWPSTPLFRSELPNPDEAPRQNVLSKAAQKFRGFLGHLLPLITMRVIFPAEGHALSIKREYAVIADSDAVRI